MPEFANALQPRVELARGNLAREVLIDRINGVPDAQNAFAGQRGDADDRCIVDEHQAVVDRLAQLVERLAAFDDVSFVHEHHHGATALGREAGNTLVLVGQTERRIDHKYGHIGAVDSAHGANEAVILDVFVDFGPLAQTRRIDDGVELTVVFDHRVDGIASRARNVAYDGPVTTDEPVGQRALPRIGTTDDGDVDGVDLLFLLHLDIFDMADNLVEKVARPMPMHRRNGPRVTKTQAVKLPNPVFFTGSVHLVDGKHNGLAAALQDASDLQVIGRRSGFSIDQKHDGVRLLGRHDGLVADGLLESVLVAHLDTARIDQREVNAIPIRLMVGAVARYAAHFVHDRVLRTRDAVDERGFAHIRSADYGDNR